jgi:hypothetical protein
LIGFSIRPTRPSAPLHRPAAVAPLKMFMLPLGAVVSSAYSSAFIIDSGSVLELHRAALVDKNFLF